MKVSLNWLRDYFEKNYLPVAQAFPSAKEIDFFMPRGGFEVESMEQAGNDTLIDFSITPNRGDCMSVRGLVREIACLGFADAAVPLQKATTFAAEKEHLASVKIDAPSACPLYTGCFIRKMPQNKKAPAWMIERLEKSSIESIHPVVDICNYVMLEMGQPLHAFDADKVKNLCVRFAQNGEKLTVLGGQTLTLASNTLVIADDHGAQAVAGVIGGLDSGVAPATTNIFLESAHFAPEAIAGRARQYGLHTEAAQRFERGVDPALPLIALDYAAALIIEHLGGEIGEYVISKGSEISAPKAIPLRKSRIERILGYEIPSATVEKILTALEMKVQQLSADYQVTPPTFRFDIAKEVDFIEELARVYGYDHLPLHQPRIEQLAPTQMAVDQFQKIRATLTSQGFREIISYSFIGENLQAQCMPNDKAVKLKNPLSAELAIMRTSLWPSLLNTAQYNFNRQQARARYFEIGRVYFNEHDAAKACLKQPMMLAGLMAGAAVPEQWSNKASETDFFDLKGEVELLLDSLKLPITFEKSERPMLHPGQAAKIISQDKVIGHLGRLHPSLQQDFGFAVPVYLFELALEEIALPVHIKCQEISKFPSVRRDFAFLLNRGQAVGEIINFVKAKLGALCVDVIVFDIYQGKNMPADQKSLAFGVVLQDKQETLADEKVTQLSEGLIQSLQTKFAMVLRDK
ncbi:MAG: phenylalanine--tRNA ligase subunit beta [Gammaproteobacteria bacterium]|jgi:phenylalanyl-tRNA synthetase beta chain|nr:phenylalanine--tRNA ligase subunit beta [Gammaproteobacteria bacterium]